ncbi:DHH family phosphoesterase [[Acholeplasma] multilocale]|uniref:DHH family phosphoesterase n=1 Tax=[Acholeplasma] multilocale TaxID=264638 RepID=UPI00047CB9C4|nr:bifunctional oligoribonuclease/PAP phosphatase NrnA [[Acholeplasma] multilocale]
MIDKKVAKLLVKKIKKYTNIIIVKHQMPDWDAQGSALGMANIIAENFTGKEVYVVGDRLNDDKTFMPKKKLTNKFVEEALIITVDTGNKARLDFDRFDMAKETFKIDHHIDVDRYADNQIIMVPAIACTQVVTMWAEMMKLKINKEAAHNLYLGLITDSGRFLFAKTNEITFRTAATLIEAGADLKAAHDYIFVSDLKMKKWKNFAFSKMVLTKTGTGYIVITKEDYKGWGLEYNEIKAALGTMAGTDEIKCWFTVIEMEDQLKVSLRSRDFDVNQVAMKYNGGGHKFASGAQLEKLEDVKKLAKDVDKLIKEDVR